MNKSIVGLIAALIFTLASAGSFYWLWSTAKVSTEEVEAIGGSYQIVEIESIKKEAADILAGLEKNADIPVTVPTERMGRTNPFVSP